ncbi:polysaccharide biosynthesis/export family protein [Anabaena sphaerica FACHB-251]|uniref:Polysaccharide biosynthesis/export family protein n=1 Tax=Anabaena sphaerica FACHB-251 TaxID=2692883 RepID=A0A926WDR1_9NOST|nr:polysaccharide biosynthesis/export family protein [Anabaena sphaerica]MBD2292240.1 polysaccharide biosynthesis/export family protein [Anabaena sphaerica FACHB-251]
MFIVPRYHKRVFKSLFFVTLQVGVGLTISVKSVVAQPVESSEQPQVEFPIPSASSEEKALNTNANEDISPQFNRYLLDTGDSLTVIVQRPPGLYRLGIGDSIGVTVQRFPDLSFQASINPEGNIVVPLLGIVSLQGLSLQEAEAKIRSGLNRYVIDPIIYLSLAGQRPDLSFQAPVNQDGNIIIPQVGQLSVKGLSVEEAQEKISLALSRITSDPVVVSLAQMRPVQVTITGEVFRPGIYSAGSAMPRITDILPLAGGSTLTADLRQVQIRRKLTDGSIVSRNIDLYAALQSGGSPPNLRLQDGDAIIVSRREPGTDDGYDRNLVARSTLAVPQIKVRVLNYAGGGIGTQSLPNGSTFLDVLGSVPLNTANLRDIALVRFDPEKGKAVTQRLDAKKALAGDASQNVALQDNDVTVVGRNLVGKLTNLLSTITQPYFNVQSFIRFFENFGNGLFGGSSK